MATNEEKVGDVERDRMPRNAEGNLAGGCGRLARFGWVFKFGAITLATCAAQRCWPDQRAGWVQGVRFRRSTPAELKRQRTGRLCLVCGTS